jgi:uncharacterized protein YeaO (DUF488 family)
MIKVKHLMDAVEDDDGQRLWVEPTALTLDLQEWCKVDHSLSHLGPAKSLWDWFDEHPDGYEYFRGQYHMSLEQSRYKPAMLKLAAAGQRENFTLLHFGDDPNHNAAAALHEFLSAMTITE